MDRTQQEMSQPAPGSRARSVSSPASKAPRSADAPPQEQPSPLQSSPYASPSVTPSTSPRGHEARVRALSRGDPEAWADILAEKRASGALTDEDIATLNERNKQGNEMAEQVLHDIPLDDDDDGGVGGVGDNSDDSGNEHGIDTHDRENQGSGSANGCGARGAQRTQVLAPRFSSRQHARSCHLSEGAVAIDQTDADQWSPQHLRTSAAANNSVGAAGTTQSGAGICRSRHRTRAGASVCDSGGDVTRSASQVSGLEEDEEELTRFASSVPPSLSMMPPIAAPLRSRTPTSPVLHRVLGARGTSSPTPSPSPVHGGSSSSPHHHRRQLSTDALASTSAAATIPGATVDPDAQSMVGARCEQTAAMRELAGPGARGASPAAELSANTSTNGGVKESRASRPTAPTPTRRDDSAVGLRLSRASPHMHDSSGSVCSRDRDRSDSSARSLARGRTPPLAATRRSFTPPPPTCAVPPTLGLEEAVAQRQGMIGGCQHSSPRARYPSRQLARRHSHNHALPHSRAQSRAHARAHSARGGGLGFCCITGASTCEARPVHSSGAQRCAAGGVGAECPDQHRHGHRQPSDEVQALLDSSDRRLTLQGKLEAGLISHEEYKALRAADRRADTLNAEVEIWQLQHASGPEAAARLEESNALAEEVAVIFNGVARARARAHARSESASLSSSSSGRGSGSGSRSGSSGECHCAACPKHGAAAAFPARGASGGAGMRNSSVSWAQPARLPLADEGAEHRGLNGIVRLDAQPQVYPPQLRRAKSEACAASLADYLVEGYFGDKA